MDLASVPPVLCLKLVRLLLLSGQCRGLPSLPGLGYGLMGLQAWAGVILRQTTLVIARLGGAWHS